ncbi:syndecan-2 [Nematolebias whitei]|uniref:syndecan-2 n=1 Tax=Nematolebias whitei TaxID=451745 RepID=UPI001897ED6B|nr:syndecan-2 [Nematolebias whitei]
MGDAGLGGELLTVEPAEEGNKKTVKLSSENKRGPPPEFFAFANNRSFWENRQILAGAVAGGITGAALGATLSAILIYKWRKKHMEECSLSKTKVSDDSY